MVKFLEKIATHFPDYTDEHGDLPLVDSGHNDTRPVGDVDPGRRERLREMELGGTVVANTTGEHPVVKIEPPTGISDH